MTTLQNTLQSLHRSTTIKDGPSREELFDANRLVELKLRLKFTFELTDPSGSLEFSLHLAQNYWSPRTEEELEGDIRYCEPLDDRGFKWRIKVRFLVKFSESDEHSYHSFSDYVETLIDYDVNSRKGKLHDKRFTSKFMRWLEEREGVPGGLYFNGRHVARIAEPKPPWEQSKNLPYMELKVSTPVFNAFGYMFQYGTIGDVAEFLDGHTDDEICRHPGIGVARLSEMKEELQRLGWNPKK